MVLLRLGGILVLVLLAVSFLVDQLVSRRDLHVNGLYSPRHTVCGYLAFGDEADDGIDCVVECLGFIGGHWSCTENRGNEVKVISPERKTLLRLQPTN